ncbi:MAG: imidazole glycerol phosphate synthase subunit HisH [Bacteroidetes bacterium]|nr:imidazole glycerol phosphate synthase subunit HisH [Bacteroidota bacterium]
MIAIIDYGLGNLRSIQYKLKRFQVESIITSDPSELDKAEKLILPGVGAFGKGMENIEKNGLREILDKKVLEDKTPILGICLGMQLFTNRSEEGNVDGLGWIDGTTRKFDFENGSELKIPHVGWNSVAIANGNRFIQDIDDDSVFYFVHSYYVECNDETDVLADTNYGVDFVSILNKGNIYGTQFHLEKSRLLGVQMLANFCKDPEIC